MNRRLICVILTAILVLLAVDVVAFGGEAERTDGGCFALVDEGGRVIHRTALMVHVGDEYITPSNQRFKVTRVKGDTAYCRFIGMEKMPNVTASSKRVTMAGPLNPGVTAQGKTKVAIYHTHNDESYNPTDGTESKRGRGGIVDVGDILQKKLQSMGIDAVHDTSSHEPHDPNAYYRSRRTATRLLKQGPNLLIDVHRDAVPPQVYRTTVKGTEVTKVKLVVARQNTNMSSNLEFAKRLKAHMDQTVPGLSGGIFMGKGNYNQDLSPRAILVEVGSNTNSKGEAEKGIAMFAQTLAPVLGVETTPAKKPFPGAKPGQKADWTTILWVIVGAGAIYAGYVYLNRGKIK